MSDSSPTKKRLPAIDGWFTDAERPALIGSHCRECGTYYFPRAHGSCRNPVCDGTDLSDTELSRTGSIWSFTNNCYPPPEPFIASDPFEGYAVVAVELAAEQMVVLGQAASGVSVQDLRVGMSAELVIEPLFTDEDTEHLVWKWKPVKEQL